MLETSISLGQMISHLGSGRLDFECDRLGIVIGDAQSTFDMGSEGSCEKVGVTYVILFAKRCLLQPTWKPQGVAGVQSNRHCEMVKGGNRSSCS